MAFSGIPDRIVSVSKPYVRPIVRGKEVLESQYTVEDFDKKHPDKAFCGYFDSLPVPGGES